MRYKIPASRIISIWIIILFSIAIEYCLFIIFQDLYIEFLGAVICAFIVQIILATAFVIFTINFSTKQFWGAFLIVLLTTPYNLLVQFTQPDEKAGTIRKLIHISMAIQKYDQCNFDFLWTIQNQYMLKNRQIFNISRANYVATLHKFQNSIPLDGSFYLYPSYSVYEEKNKVPVLKISEIRDQLETSYERFVWDTLEYYKKKN